MGFNNVPYSKNVSYVKRENKINQIREKLKVSNSVVLYGMWGVGKTQLSHTYSKEFNQEYNFVVWANGESDETITESFITFSKSMDFYHQSWDEQELIDEVKAWFEKNSKWLLIIDNASSEDFIYKYTPSIENGHLIVTSRNSNWNSLGTGIEVYGLERNESQEFLKLKDFKSDEIVITNFCNTLEDHPLAIDQAISYMNLSRISMEQYLTRLEKYQGALLDKGGSIDYKKTVTATCMLSMEEISKDNSLSIELIKVLSFFSSDNIRMDEIRKITKKYQDVLSEDLSNILLDDLCYDELVQTISSYSILKILNNESFSMHRLLQLIVRDSLTSTEKMEYGKKAAKLVIQIFKIIDNGEGINLIQSHAISVFNYLSDYQILSELQKEIAKNISEEYYNARLFLKAKEFYMKELELYDCYSDRYYEIEIVLSDISIKLGEYNLVEYRLKSLLDKKEELSDNILSNIYSNLAISMEKNDQFEESLCYFKRSIELQDKVSNMTEEQIIMHIKSMNGMAELLTRKGEINKAEVYYKKALRISKKHFGLKSPSTASIYGNFGNSLSDTDLKKAKKYLKIALEFFESTPDSSIYSYEIDRIRNNLGLVLFSESKINKSSVLQEESLKMFEESLVSVREMFGDSHIRVAIRLNNIGLVYSETQEYEKAILYYEQALEINKNTYLKPNQVVATNIFNIGIAMIEQGNLKGGIKRMEDALDLEVKIYGENSSQLICTLYHLSFHHLKNNKLKAKKFVIKALEIAENTNEEELVIPLNEIKLLVYAIDKER